MKLVADNSPEDLARADAAEAFEQALRDLTGNLIRVTRGAGKPYDVGNQAVELIEAMKAYQASHRHWPSSDTFNRALRRPEPLDRANRSERAYAIDNLISGSLRVVAAELLEQHLQVAAGEREIENGLHSYEGWLRELRERQRLEDAADRASRRTAPKPRKKPGPTKVRPKTV